MNVHLSHEEVVDAIDGRLAPSRRAHVNECQVCADEVATYAAMLVDVRDAGDQIEPSPLFWDHFSARTRAAIDAAPSQPRWHTWIRPVGLLAAAAALVLAVWMRSPAPPSSSEVTPSLATAAALNAVLPEIEDGPLPMVMELAAELPWEEVQQATAPRSGTADALIDELSPAEREAFVTLLKREIGDLE